MDLGSLPAFPQHAPVRHTAQDRIVTGITIRQFYIGMALAGSATGKRSHVAIVKKALKIADWMLENE